MGFFLNAASRYFHCTSSVEENLHKCARLEKLFDESSYVNYAHDFVEINPNRSINGLFYWTLVFAILEIVMQSTDSLVGNLILWVELREM